MFLNNDLLFSQTIASCALVLSSQSHFASVLGLAHVVKMQILKNKWEKNSLKDLQLLSRITKYQSLVMISKSLKIAGLFTIVYSLRIFKISKQTPE